MVIITPLVKTGKFSINVFVYIFPNHGRLQTTLFHWNINYMKDALYARNGLDAWGRGPSHATKYRYKRTLFIGEIVS